MKVKKFINFSTVWEDYDSLKENPYNLYSAYKLAFSKIINFYKKNLNKIKFYELMISDTFGHNDERIKIINVIKKNYKKNKTTKLKSKNLYINLLNVEAIRTICQLASKKQKIIYLTSNSGYGIGKKNKYCDENSPLNPVSLYGKTKNEAEKIVLQRGNCIAFRLATVFGFSYRMRTDLLVNFMTLKALKEGEIKVFEPHFRRNFIHVRDVANAILFSIKNYNR